MNKRIRPQRLAIVSLLLLFALSCGSCARLARDTLGYDDNWTCWQKALFWFGPGH